MATGEVSLHPFPLSLLGCIRNALMLCARVCVCERARAFSCVRPLPAIHYVIVKEACLASHNSTPIGAEEK